MKPYTQPKQRTSLSRWGLSRRTSGFWYH